MGFLTMAYGKLAAGRNYRQIQSRLVRVQRELQRTTKQIGEQQKTLERQKRDAINALTSGFQAAKMSLTGGIGSFGSIMSSGGIDNLINMYADTYNVPKKDDGTYDMNSTEGKALSSYLSQTNLTNSYTNTIIDQILTKTKSELENYYDDYIDQQMQPLKDMEEELTLEKENLESQAQLAKQDYEAMKEGEKSDAQMMKPNYTGSGG